MDLTSRKIRKGFIIEVKIILFIFLVTAACGTILNTVIIADLLRNFVKAIIEQNATHLRSIAFSFLIVSMTIIILTIFRKRSLFKFEYKYRLKLEDNILEKCNDFSSWNHKLTPGEVGARVKESCTSLSSKVAGAVNEITITFITIIISVIYAYSINPLALIVGLIFTLLIFIITHNSSKVIPDLQVNLSDSFSRIYAKQWDVIHNYEIIPYIDKEKLFFSYNEELKNTKELQVKFNKSVTVQKITKSFGNLGIVLLAATVGSYQVHQGVIEIHDIISLIIILPIISREILGLPSLYANLKAIKGLDEHIDQFLNNPSEIIKDSEKKVEKVDNLSVNINYLEIENRKLLRRVQHTFIPRNITCIAGKSGVGKTSLLRIITGTSNILEDQVKVNGQCINSIDLDSYWSRIFIDTQNPVIFPTTLLQNITLFDKEVDPKRLEDAVKLSLLDQVITKKQISINEEISPSNFSSGEAQRIALARMFYMERDLYILDEITTAIDDESKQIIFNNIRDFCISKNKIIIYATHDINMLELADKVILLREKENTIVDKFENIAQNDLDSLADYYLNKGAKS